MDEKKLLTELEKHQKILDECEDDQTAAEALKATAEIYLKLADINIIKYGFDASDRFETLADWLAHETDDLEGGAENMKIALKLICLLADTDDSQLKNVGGTCSEYASYLDDSGSPDADTFEELSRIFFQQGSDG